MPSSFWLREDIWKISSERDLQHAINKMFSEVNFRENLFVNLFQNLYRYRRYVSNHMHCKIISDASYSRFSNLGVTTKTLI